jgi:hypothetical protein
VCTSPQDTTTTRDSFNNAAPASAADEPDRRRGPAARHGQRRRCTALQSPPQRFMYQADALVAKQLRPSRARRLILTSHGAEPKLPLDAVAPGARRPQSHPLLGATHTPPSPKDAGSIPRHRRMPHHAASDAASSPYPLAPSIDRPLHLSLPTYIPPSALAPPPAPPNPSRSAPLLPCCLAPHSRPPAFAPSQACVEYAGIRLFGSLVPLQPCGASQSAR